ncbi:MAG TPA: hypothetical protein VFV11_08265 [Solimonas sp.]|nr:hypothetical protein [Solimonas sp.]
MLRSLTLAAAALAGLLAAPAVSAGQLQCWTDDQGRRACGDRVPPEYAKKERQVYNEKGRLVDIKEREKTAEESAAEAEAARREAEARQQKEEQVAYDRFLVDTFATVRDLEKMRDGRIAAIDSRIALTEKGLADNQVALKSLRAQPPGAGKAAERQKAKIAEFEKTLAGNERALAQAKAEREQTQQRFARDIERYRQLKGLPPEPAASVPATPPAAAPAVKP